jgi:hypothetical protein
VRRWHGRRYQFHTGTHASSCPNAFTESNANANANANAYTYTYSSYAQRWIAERIACKPHGD